MLALGAGIAVVGVLGVRDRITYALGGWTRDAATPESWRRTHLTIGRWLIVAGAVAVGTGLIALAVPQDRVGPVVVAGSIVLLVPTVLGLVRGLGQLERR